MKTFRRVFSGGVVLAIVFVVFQWAKGSSVDTGLLSLLPSKESDPLLAETSDLISRQGSRIMAFSLTHPDADSLARLGQRFIDNLKASGQVAVILNTPSLEKELAFRNLYFPLRYQLLSGNDRDKISRPGALPYFLQRTRGILYSPATAFLSSSLSLDPFLFFMDYMKDALENVNLGGNGNSFFLAAEIKGDPFNSKTQEAFFTWFNAFRKTLMQEDPSTALYSTGVMSFAHAQREQTERELWWMSLGSILGVMGILAWAFQKPAPMAMAILPVGVGWLAGYAATVALFGRIHVITLTFGTTLIGCGVDYPIHFLAHRQMVASGESDPAIKKITPGLILSLATSLMGYMALGVEPLPGLRQIAVFSSVGLLVALGAVYAWLPRFRVKDRAHPALHPLVRGARGGMGVMERLWNGPRLPRILMSFVFVWAVAAGLSRIQFNDDVRRLQNTPPAIVKENAEVRRGGSFEGYRFILIDGPTEEILLKRQERLYDRLSLFKKKGILSSIQSLAPWVPSRERQENNTAAIRDLILSHPVQIQKEFMKMGFSPEVGKQLIKEVTQESAPFNVEMWLDSPASEGVRSLWLGKKGDRFVSVTLVAGVENKTAFEKSLSDLEGVRYFDQLEEFSNVLGRYRKKSMLLVGIASAFACLLLMLRYGVRGGLWVNLPPLLAILLTFSFFGWIHLPLNIFHILAALLVFAMGVDYAIFFSESHRTPELLNSALFSVSLSALTTLVSFGLLGFCSTPAVAALGQTTFWGLLFSFLFSPIPFVLQRTRGAP